MANHPSAIKRHRQSLKNRERNRAARTQLRTAVKKARAAIVSNDAKAKELVVSAERLLAKAATKHLIHRNNASRSISRLYKALAKVGDGKPAAKSTKKVSKAK